MMVYGSAVMVNLRRLHAYCQDKATKSEAEGAILPFLALVWPFLLVFGLHHYSGFEAPAITDI